MAEWTTEQLERIGGAEEVRIESVGEDGRLGKPVTIWAVRHGSGIYVRSVRGREGRWYRGVQKMRRGRIRGGGVQQDVTFEEAESGVAGEVDEAYRTKYRRYAGAILNSVLTPQAGSATVKLVPRSRSD
jgi:hypothetical protein